MESTFAVRELPTLKMKVPPPVSVRVVPAAMFAVVEKDYVPGVRTTPPSSGPMAVAPPVLASVV